ncbi:PREDICTED: uncharacterized protein LOC109482702 [Branchiostoma belcheri]|uniref:Uncharacterized protein LOC109482702 n=1 Tax=Branchiostoma belcheri TaxID=7741 RepID=A0A6P4ZIN7_BRABE|nr:PREDICTED: uncharacterized protein LOC109482702 [Branchiostoma belcheri]
MASRADERDLLAGPAGMDGSSSRRDARVASVVNRYAPKSYNCNKLHPHRESPSPYRGLLAVPSPLPSPLSEEDPEEAPGRKRSEARRRQTLIRLLLNSVNGSAEEESDMLKKSLTWAAGLKLESGGQEARLLRKNSGVTPEETMLKLRRLSLRRRRQSLMSSRASSVRLNVTSGIRNPEEIRRRWRKAVRAVQLVLVATRA